MAFEITWDLVLATAKDESDNLAAFTVPEQTIILDETYLEVPAIYGDGWTQTLRRYWAAHIAVQSMLESAGEGALTSEAIGGVSANKNQPVNNPGAKEGHLETTYGRTYFNYLENWKASRTVSFGILNNARLEGFARSTEEAS